MKIVTNSLLYIMSNGFSKGLPFLLLPVLTRYLSVESFGVLGLCLTFVGILSIFAGLNPSVFVITKFNKLDKRALGISIFQIILTTLVLSSASSLFLLFYAKNFFEYGVSSVMILTIVLISLSRVMVSLGLTVLQMERRVWDYFWVSISFALPTMMITFGLLALVGANWEAVLISELITGLVLSIYMVRFLVSEGFLVTEYSFIRLREFLSFSIPLVPHALALWVMNSIDRVFLAEATDMGTVGLYSTAYLLGLGISLLHESFQRVWQPYFFEYLEKDDFRLKQKMVQYTWLYYFVGLLVFFLYLGAIRLFLPLIVGEEYLDSMEFIPPIVLGYTVFGMYRAVAGYLYHANKTAILAGLTVVSAVVNIAFNYVLIPINGALGAAQATLIAFLFLFVSVKIVVVKNCGMPWFEFLALKSDSH